MNLKDYREMPDEGLFEKIERRVRLRRLARIGGVVAAVALVAVTAVWLLPKGGAAVEEHEVTVSAAVPAVVAIEPTMVGNTQEQNQTTPETSLVNNEIQTAEKVQPVTRRSEMLNPQVPEPISINVQPIASAEQPLLPPAAVHPEATPMDDLILEGMEQDNNVDVLAQPVKSGESTPETPHYDNVLWAPNVIVPMDDNADNRIFKVVATSTVSDFRMAVYNRGGRMVFNTNDINRGWDATHDGSLLPQGTYVWVARFRDSDGVLRQEKGTVTVVR